MVSSAAKQAITAATWEVSGALGGEQHDAEARTGTDPFPRCCFGKESTCDRANSGTEEGSGGENAHGQSTLIGREPGEDQHTNHRVLLELFESRSRVTHMSAMTPPAEVSGLEPNIPAKKRKTSSVSSDLAPQTPALNAVNGR